MKTFTTAPSLVLGLLGLQAPLTTAYWQCYRGAWGSAISSTNTDHQIDVPVIQKCLQDYNSTAYRGNYNGYTCGGVNFFKGTRSGVYWNDPAACFDGCAPLIADVLTRQAVWEVQCDACAFAYGGNGGAQCWMGFNQAS